MCFKLHWVSRGQASSIVPHLQNVAAREWITRRNSQKMPSWFAKLRKRQIHPIDL
ncbi:hypothetical protein RB483 [Rhodopirellula baltica SH 1]|uniref:Uncharacterized protein n=1 Tax=Rhodopirellula baltica (strain DSM 10527 / NCIMB 13988 / SH1) TaxID=243090 RepID=Q7UYN2_RHOBA|nr:hypothetical protein RB483 [Rhodopirellula baltica SH 1]